MLKRPLQCSCQTKLNVQIQTCKRDHCSAHIKCNVRPSSIISDSNLENLEHIKLQPNLPVCFLKQRVHFNKFRKGVVVIIY